MQPRSAHVEEKMNESTLKILLSQCRRNLKTTGKHHHTTFLQHKQTWTETHSTLLTHWQKHLYRHGGIKHFCQQWYSLDCSVCAETVLIHSQQKSTLKTCPTVVWSMPLPAAFGTITISEEESNCKGTYLQVSALFLKLFVGIDGGNTVHGNTRKAPSRLTFKARGEKKKVSILTLDSQVEVIKTGVSRYNLNRAWRPAQFERIVTFTFNLSEKT